MAEQYVGISRDEAYKLRQDVLVKDVMLKNLEKYLQELADRSTAAEARGAEAEAQMAKRHVTEPSMARPDVAASTEVKKQRHQGGEKEVKESMVKMEREYIAPKVAFSSSDYLADIYDDCMKQAPQGVNATARLRQARCRN